MSDFDEEAERKRLREKYEKDEEQRKETQQMSELLLKGATMTNRHCDECGSPIFRHEGQAFCPTCQQVVGSGQADESESPDETESPDESESPDETESPDASAQPAGSARMETAETPGASNETSQATDDTHRVATETTDAANARSADGSIGVDAAPADESGGRRDTAGAAASTGGADVRTTNADAAASAPRPGDGESAPSERTARESLLRALTRHARLAEETTDPRRARDHLAASREAAEALDELD